MMDNILNLAAEQYGFDKGLHPRKQYGQAGTFQPVCA